MLNGGYSPLPREGFEGWTFEHPPTELSDVRERQYAERLFEKIVVQYEFWEPEKLNSRREILHTDVAQEYFNEVKKDWRALSASHERVSSAKI